MFNCPVYDWVVRDKVTDDMSQNRMLSDVTEEINEKGTTSIYF